LGVFALFGWRPERVWWWLAAGLVVFTAADTAYLFATATNTCAPGGPIDLCWQVGRVLPARGLAADARHSAGAAARAG